MSDFAGVYLVHEPSGERVLIGRRAEGRFFMPHALGEVLARRVEVLYESGPNVGYPRPANEHGLTIQIEEKQDAEETEDEDPS